MTKLKVKTASTQAGKAVAVSLGTDCRRALVKNFSTGDIWVGVTPDSTKTDGMIRIPSEVAQLLVSFCAGQYGDLINTVYVLADTTEENCVEVRVGVVGGSHEKNRTGNNNRDGIYRLSLIHI